MAKMIRGDQIVTKKDFTWRRKLASQWMLVAVGGLVAVVGLMLVGHLTSQAIDPRWARDQSPAEPVQYKQPGGGSLARAVLKHEAPVPTVLMTPELVRHVLTLSERDQMALVLQADTPQEQERQREIIDQLVLSQPTVLAPVIMKRKTALEAHEEDEDETTEHGHTRHHVHHLAEDGSGGHELTPSQESAARLWALIFITFIVTASVIFETCKEVIMHNTPETMTVVVDKFFGELATLGFIGTLAFVFTTGFAGHPSALGHISFWFMGDDELLIHEFEIVHFLIFFVMVFFVSAVLVILQIAVNQKRVWDSYEETYLLAKKATGPLAESKMLKMMDIPDELTEVSGSVTSEYTKSRQVREAEFIRFRQRFLQDVDCPVEMPEDFEFAGYLTMMSAKILAEIVEIEVWDWTILWVLMFIIFFINSVLQSIFPMLNEGLAPVYLICVMFALVQVGLVLAAVLAFRSLAYIRSKLVPGLDQQTVEKITKQELESSSKSRTSSAAMGRTKSKASQAGGRTGSKVSQPEKDEFKAEAAVLPPPYTREMSLMKAKDEGIVGKLLHLMGGHRKPSKHEQLFGSLGAHGPEFFIHFIKLILLTSVVSVAILCVCLFGVLWELNFLLPFLAVIPAIISIVLTPRLVILYVWCASCEMMKDTQMVISVVRKMRHARLINIIRILSMLSFFLDQVEFLKSLGGGEADGEHKQAVTDAQWEKLISETDSKLVEDLESLFSAYDEDHSGELEVDEVKELVAQMGTHLTDEEAANLFRVMDADGSGSVDFKEFATVILHQKQQNKHINYRELAEKMFAIFDQDGSGAVQAEEILEQMKKMGKNWDTEGIAFFLSQIDQDGGGIIEKHEFVDYILKVEAEVKCA